MLRKLLLLALTAAYAWVIWRMTLTPQLFSSSQTHLVAEAIRFAQHLPGGSSLTYDRAEFLANVAMFVPVGVIAALWMPRRAWILGALFAVALSVGIEYAQHRYLPGRVADPRDVLSNGLGGLLGATLVGVVRGLVPQRRRRARRRPRTV